MENRGSNYSEAAWFFACVGAAVVSIAFGLYGWRLALYSVGQYSLLVLSGMVSIAYACRKGCTRVSIGVAVASFFVGQYMAIEQLVIAAYFGFFGFS